MTTGERYDEVLPERATVPCTGDAGRRWSAGDCPSSHLGEDDRHVALVPARAGDTIEVPCPECGGSGWIDGPCLLDGCEDTVCRTCSSDDYNRWPGTLRVLLTEDPAPKHVAYEPLGDAYEAGWRHVGTVTP